ncbi:cysteine-rich and transmembrane domain-containing protein WIH1-like [Neltuma alba]|uniref:cysteine-rich and transmembrane domain-containing protein WIH1-like n=1 Tax=Neltuma alba TaxID=207710 RepID=UPI0010A4EA65|nr:cysteine-rich and transmembrane domain-containing protein WIH1-like [Prosopis alba]
MNHHYNQQDPPGSYPSPMMAYPLLPTGSALPPMGYPSKDNLSWDPKQSVPQQTMSRGDGFWEGCCAVFCCCCILDYCF